MLNDGLARAEGAGNGGGAALCDGEQGIDDTLTRVHGTCGDEFSGVGSVNTDRPALHHAQLVLNALFVLQHRDGIRHGEAALFHGQQGAAQSGGHHYLMGDRAGLLHGADNVAAGELIPRLRGGNEVPLLAAVERGNVGAAADARAGHLAYLGQGALDTVIDILQHAGPELNGHGHARCLDHRAGAEAGGLLINLNGGLVSAHIKYLAYKSLGAHAHNVGYVRVAQALCNHKRARNFDDSSAHTDTFLS